MIIAAATPPASERRCGGDRVIPSANPASTVRMKATATPEMGERRTAPDTVMQGHLTSELRHAGLSVPNNPKPFMKKLRRPSRVASSEIVLPPRQYGGDGLYYLMDGTRRVNKMHMNRQTAKELNVSRKLYGHPQWRWSGKR